MTPKNRTLTRYLSLTLLTSLLAAPGLPALAQAPPVTPAATTETIHLEGQVIDAHTNTPLKGVYVRQKDALNAVFSDAQGRFKLDLQTGFAPMVLFEAEGYEPVALPFTASQNRLRVNLQPLKSFTTKLPPAHAKPEAPKPTGIFGNQFSALYQADYTLFAQNNVGISGLVLNELGLSTDLTLFEPLVFRARFLRSRMPIDIANFPFTPAFFINHQQAKIGLGTLVNKTKTSEFYLGADIMYDNRSPDNRNNQDQQPVAFTGSLLDNEQNRLGIGLNAAMGMKLTDRFTLFPEATFYPAMINIVTNNSPHYMMAGEIGARLRFEIVNGVYAVGSYYNQLWYSFGPGAIEDNNYFHLGLSVDPWAIAAGMK